MKVCRTLVVSIAALLSLVFVTPLTPDTCHLPASCTCHSPGSDYDNCYVTTVDVSDTTISALPPEMTSLQLICSESDLVSHLIWGLFTRLSRLRRLSISNCQFATVQPSVFQHLLVLESLEIVGCSFLQPLPADLLTTLPRLSSLSLLSNNLHEMPSLCGLSQLAMLNVSHQVLPMLQQSVVQCDDTLRFQSLVVLNITNASLSVFPEKLISRAPNLRELHCGLNQIQVVSLPQGLGLTQLEALDLYGNQLHNLDFLSKLPLTQMRVLRLQGNSRVAMPVDTVWQLQNVSDLTLANLDIDDSVWSELSALTKLESLGLANNRLTTFNLTSSVRAQLLQLDLAGNCIDRLDEGTFADLPALRDLDLSGNCISRLFNNAFSQLTSLTRLNLQTNNLTFVSSQAFSDLRLLQWLHLDNNLLTSLSPFALRNMTSLQEFHVSGNRLPFLPNFRDLPALFLVNANDNLLTELVWRVFRGAYNLEFLFLRNNGLRHISLCYEDLPWLRVVDLRNNRIENIESGAFDNLPSLGMVRLEDNFLSQVDHVFNGMKSLRFLSLDNNSLSQLTINMFPQSVQYISVGSNHLSYIERGLLLNLPHLRILMLSVNWLLLTVDITEMQVPPTLVPKPVVFLGLNHFDCDCRLGYLKAWAQYRQSVTVLREHLPDFQHLEILLCSTYLGSVALPFHNVPLEEFVCPYKTPICYGSCPCCTASSETTPFDPMCSCVLTCPDNCTCFIGGSEYVRLFDHVICSSRNLDSVPEGIPSQTTHLRLDGNNFGNLKNDSMSGLDHTLVLYLNDTRLHEVQEGAFRSLVNVTSLDLSHNYLERVSRHMFGNLSRLAHLYLHDNLIRTIESGALEGLTMLATLTIHHNLIKSLGGILDIPLVTSLTLADNPWPCDCHLVPELLRFWEARNYAIADREAVRCFWYEGGAEVMRGHEETNSTGQRGVTRVPLPTHPGEVPDAAGHYSLLLADLQYDVLCSARPVVHQRTLVAFFDDQTHVAAIAAMLAVVAVVVVVGTLMVWRRREVQALVYVKLGVRLWDNVTSRLDHEEDGVSSGHACGRRQYDAFVSYSHLDEDFVSHVLVPRLEQTTHRRYRLCVHYRDFPVGAAIADTIIESIETSKRTLLILSENFLDSEWCLFEFRTALHHVLQKDTHRLVAILLTELPAHRLDSDLKVVLKTRTYLRVSDPWFWEKLYFALPDLPSASDSSAGDPGQNTGDTRPDTGNARLDTGDIRFTIFHPRPENRSLQHDLIERGDSIIGDNDKGDAGDNDKGDAGDNNICDASDNDIGDTGDEDRSPAHHPAKTVFHLQHSSSL